MTPDKESSNAPGQVMDVQPPKDLAFTEVPDQVQEDQVVPAPTEELASDANVAEQAPVEGVKAESAPQQSESPGPILAAVPKEGHSHRMPVLAVTLAVIVAGTLAGIAVMSYVGTTPKQGASTQTSQTPKTEQNKPAAATVSDVDTTSSEIDKQLNSVDDSSDYADSTVSDTTLSL